MPVFDLGNNVVVGHEVPLGSASAYRLALELIERYGSQGFEIEVLEANPGVQLVGRVVRKGTRILCTIDLEPRAQGTNLRVRLSGKVEVTGMQSMFASTSLVRKIAKDKLAGFLAELLADVQPEPIGGPEPSAVASGLPEPPVEPEPVEPEPDPVELQPAGEPKPEPVVASKPRVEPAQSAEPEPIEPKPVVEPKPIKVAPVVEPKPIKVAPVVEPKPIKVAPVVEPKPIKVAPVVEPKPIKVEPVVETGPIDKPDSSALKRQQRDAGTPPPDKEPGLSKGNAKGEGAWSTKAPKPPTAPPLPEGWASRAGFEEVEKRLGVLSRLYEGGLITFDDYREKKREVLERYF